LIALINQNLGRPAGFINPLLYQNPALAGHFNGIASGNNGAYSASPGWNPCAGLGSPNGSQIAAALGAPPPAQATKTMPISKIANE
jgi:kumamolisin